MKKSMPASIASPRTLNTPSATRWRRIFWWLALVFCSSSSILPAATLSSEFTNPPASARPWVYWFWNNGNVTKAGITADLEAMKRAGIGGVIIMDVVERFAPPPGSADFMNAEWQGLFKHAVTEAHRLGIEINMTNGPGWCGSSGPWITPELSMQKLVSSNLVVQGPTNFAGIVPRARPPGHRETDVFDSRVDFAGFYRDVAVLAYPARPDGIVPPDSVQDLTARLRPDGSLEWNVPEGKWILQRIGHTSTGSSTRPPVKGGNGLECDKLNARAMDIHFTNMMGPLIQSVGGMAGPTLSATHIDSWEVGTQNWTPMLAAEFQKRRRYDPLPFLPNIIVPNTREDGRPVIGDDSMARRFRWDFQQTVSELLAENYVGRLAERAHQHGMRLTIEGYNLPFGDEATYTQRADEPMTEFWATGGNEDAAKGRQMASVAHVMGKTIVGAEAFTANDSEQWKMHPATVKAQGDYQFCQGINRLVIHRYAHQPYLDRYPGATMGPWGLHYERTQTWWEMSGAWHAYLSRCQFLLRQGLFVADLLYLRPELPDQTYFHPDPAPPAGYKYDEISAEALIDRAEVKGGRLVLPDGMSYRVLVLPAGTRLMTPALATKVKQLVAAGAVVVGPSPTASPSLADFPRCDQEVASLAAEVWGDCNGRTVTEHTFGNGKVVWGKPLQAVLDALRASADFTSSVKLNWIHRRVGDTEVYFVANERSVPVEVACQFRVTGLRPEMWDPETGKISPIATFQEEASGISIPLRLEQSGSTFIVFRSRPEQFDPVVTFTRNGEPAWPLPKPPVIQIQSAIYGVPGDAARTRDVSAKVQAMVDRGELKFPVRQLAEGDDPAFGVVKTLVLNYAADGHSFAISAQDPEEVLLDTSILLTTGADGIPGLKGEYFANRDLGDNPVMTRTDAGIRFSWNRGSPAPGIPADHWSARWTGRLTALQSGEYTFRIFADDGCRLLIDGKRVIDHWNLDSGVHVRAGKVKLVAGLQHELRVEYFEAQADARIHLSWLTPAPDRPATLHCDSAGTVAIVATQPGRYAVTRASGKTRQVDISNVPAPREISGPWEVRFPSRWGAPERIALDPLASLSTSTNPGVRFYSGTATYTKAFDWRPSPEEQKTRTWLDLGDVQVMAQVKLNGQDLGVLWKPPFQVDVSGVLKPGSNRVEIEVANLWPNRMIGDAALPIEKRFTWSSYEPFTPDSPLPESGLLGPVTLRHGVIAE